MKFFLLEDKKIEKIIPPEQSEEGGRNFIMACHKMAWCTVCVLPSVTSFSAHTSVARGMKIGMRNPYMNASKVTNQIFDILPRSRDI